MLSHFQGVAASQPSNASALYSSYTEGQLVQLCRLYRVDFEVLGFDWPPACAGVMESRTQRIT